MMKRNNFFLLIFLFQAMGCYAMSASASRSLLSRAITSARNHPVLTVGTLGAGLVGAYALYKWWMQRPARQLGVVAPNQQDSLDPQDGTHSAVSEELYRLSPQEVVKRNRALKQEDCYGENREKQKRAKGIAEVTGLMPDLVAIVEAYEPIMVFDSVCKTTLNHDVDIRAMTALHNGRVVVLDANSEITIWDLATGQSHLLKVQATWIDSLAALADGRLAVGFDKKIEIWNLATEQCEKVLQGHTGSIRSFAVLSGGRLASGSDDTTIRVWNLATGRCEKTLEGHVGSVISLVEQPEDRLAFRTENKTIGVWNLATGRREQRLTIEHPYGICAMAVLPDGCFALAFDYEASIRIVNVSTGRCEKILLERGQHSVHSLAVLRDGRLVSGELGGVIRIWNLKTGQCEQELQADPCLVNSLVQLPDGRFVSGSGMQKSGPNIRIWG